MAAWLNSDPKYSQYSQMILDGFLMVFGVKIRYTMNWINTHTIEICGPIGLTHGLTHGLVHLVHPSRFTTGDPHLGGNP
jgi:hypothetical protein